MFPSTCHLLIIYLCLLLLLLMSSNMFFSLMDPNKSLGPYGLNPAFYKKLWNLCGPNIFTATISWLENGSLPQQINQTSIVLIPKIPNPVTMKEFRPISLGNILYKIISKTLANRINPLLTKCISWAINLCRGVFYPWQCIYCLWDHSTLEVQNERKRCGSSSEIWHKQGFWQGTMELFV